MTENILAKLEIYQERTKNLLDWLFNEFRGDQKQIAAALSIHPANVCKIFNGTYTGNIELMTDRVEAVKLRRDRILNNLFIEGETASNIFDVLDRTRDFGTMSLIQGASRRGKTAAVKEWIRRNSDGFYNISYIDCPADKSTKSFILEVAKSIRVSQNGSRYQVSERIQDKLTNRDILIFDESTRLLQRGMNTDALEFIRRLHDQQQVAVVFIATGWFDTEVQSGRLAVYLEQLVGRLEDRLTIPKDVSRSEVRKFLSPYVEGGKANDELMKLAMKVVRGKGKLADLSRHINDALLLARALHQDKISSEFFLASIEERSGKSLWSEPNNQ